MRRVPYTVVHSFTSTLFAGNPAGVCRLVEWLPDDLLQAIATENNLSETAFLVGGDGRYDLRWFTPAVEVDLCGHATLASAWVLLHGPDRNRAVVSFDTASGRLEVERRGDELAMDFPARPAEACETPPALIEGLRATPTAVLRARDYLAVFDRPEQVRDLDPAFDRLARLGGTGVIATAPGPFGPSGDDVDFVSRFFAPAAGIDEDPVTGSAHCTLIPYWAERLGRTTLAARQISARGGALTGTLRGDRCELRGGAVVYSEGWLLVPDPGVVGTGGGVRGVEEVAS
ncbi:MAG: PhzF family phenazine biosynthesis protein [Phycisphaerales bacterium]|nr:PhzF family phenazine biosynthesis protein [Phycisphaerales bacterium]NNM26928.1 PhzF family phenazine biosynthesis protein [Phycisphaerales bacterium]